MITPVRVPLYSPLTPYLPSWLKQSLYPLNWNGRYILLSPKIPVRTMLLEVPAAYIFRTNASLDGFSDICKSIDAVFNGPVNTEITKGPDIFIKRFLALLQKLSLIYYGYWILALTCVFGVPLFYYSII